MITYLTTNPPIRIRTQTSAVMAGAALRMIPPNWSANEERPRRGAEKDAGVGGEEEPEEPADHADDDTERPHAPTAPVLEEDVQCRQERQSAEPEQGPGSHVHG